ncbi:uncharacterized protein LOC142586961 [Dermacentor variabilis]|uniref:uncharacterized protein LOC142586961 n=1 Tax=Dermacentor variabilis TaxID=34621 RepID=UPI003F5C8B12
MTHSVTSLVVVFSVGIIVASATYKTDCVFTGLDLDGALASVISQLSIHEEQMKRIGSYRDILDVECCSISGLQRLRQYGPLLPYCVNGTRKFQVDLVHDGPIEMIMNWRWYNGMKGTLALGAQLSRLTLQFVVSEKPLGKIALRLENPLVPVATEMTYAAVQGVGETARAVTAIWSELLPSLTQRVWNEYFLANLRKAVCEVQLDLFAPHEEANLQKGSSTAFTEYTELDACTH